MTIPRTKCLSTKLTDDEYAALEAKAGAQTLSTWARETLLGAVREHPAALAPTLGESVVVAEVLALRAILVNLGFALATGDDITADRMRQLIDHADRDKGTRAAEHLEAARGTR
jgi:hypothetical protein